MTEYQHGEAFALMRYRCRNCEHQEIIWNSRDGVTPFGLRCPSCGEVGLTHVDWSRDVRDPDYVCHPGQRFFRDGTPDEAHAIIEKRVISFLAAGHSVPLDVQQKLKRDALNTEGEWHKGWPMVERTPE